MISLGTSPLANGGNRDDFLSTRGMHQIEILPGFRSGAVAEFTNLVEFAATRADHAIQFMPIKGMYQFEAKRAPCIPAHARLDRCRAVNLYDYKIFGAKAFDVCNAGIRQAT